MATTITTVRQLGTTAIAVPQCIDNQFMPRSVFEALTSQDQTLAKIIQTNLGGQSTGVASAYANAQKTEYIRTLIFSDRVVLNRAAFWNSPTLICSALGPDRSGLVELLAGKIIVPFLQYESAFDQPPAFGYLEAGERAVRSLADDPALTELTCVTLGGANESLNKRRIAGMAEGFRLELSRLHMADDPLGRARQIAHTLLQERRNAAAKVDALAGRVLEVAEWAARQPVNRNAVYERFLTVGTPAEGVFRGDPFTFELKMWIDLLYTSNLPRFLRARSFTPQGFPTPLDLDISWALAAADEAEAYPDSGDPVIDDVSERIRSWRSQQAWDAIVKAATVAVPAPHEIDHNDLVVIRGWDEWRAMTSTMERHLDAPLDPAGLDEMNAAYRQFLLRLGRWWAEQRRVLRGNLAAGVAKVYRVGDWTIGLLRLGNELLPIFPAPGVELPSGLDGVVKAVVETTLYVFDRGRVELRRSQAVRGLEKVQRLSEDRLREFERVVRGLYPELMQLPYAASASTTPPLATEEESA